MTVAGSKLTFGTFLSPGKLDPVLVSGGITGGNEIAALYDVLFTYDRANDKVIPHLAESITPNSDHTVWTLLLRPGVSFSDGTPLSGQLVADNIQRYFEKAAVSPARALLGMIESTKVVDERTVEFRLAHSWFEFPKIFADQPGMIVNTRAIGADPAAFAQAPPESAGVGPYVLERNVPGEEIVMRARKDYWDGPVCVETIRFVSIPGAKATYEAFKSGDIDVAFIREADVIDAAEKDGFDSATDFAHGGTTLYLNHTAGKPASDPRVREAIWLALDEKSWNDRVAGGVESVAKSLLHPDFFSASADLIVKPTDPSRAAALVDEAKAAGYDGKLNIVCPTTPPSPDTALAFESMLEAVGFDVEVQTVPGNEHITQVFQSSFEAACWGLGLNSSMLASNLYRAFYGPGQNFQRTAYRSDEMDKALLAALAASTPETQRSTITAVSNVFANDNVAAVVGGNRMTTIWKPRVKNLEFATNSMVLLAHVKMEGQ